MGDIPSGSSGGTHPVVIGIGVIMLAATIFAFAGKCGEAADDFKKESRKLDTIGAAKQILESDHLLAPSSAKYQDEVIAYSKDNRYIVALTVDSQNGFGAMLRKHLCVAFTMQGDNLKASKTDSFKECSNPPAPAELDAIREAMGWAK